MSETPSTDNEVSGYAYPETPESVTSSFCRSLEKSLRKSISNKDEVIAKTERENARLRAELNNIANAKPSEWGSESDQFQAWAQSRARFALSSLPNVQAQR